MIPARPAAVVFDGQMIDEPMAPRAHAILVATARSTFGRETGAPPITLAGPRLP
jgi:hypothetical protein